MQIFCCAKTNAEAMNLACRCLIFLFLLHPFMIKSSADSKCPKSFNCGNLGALQFPLADSVEPECGIFAVNCTSEPPRIQFAAGEVWSDILQKVSTNKFRVRDFYLDLHLAEKSCFSFQNRSLPHSPLSSSSTISPNLTIFSCSKFLDPDDREKFQDYFQNYRNYNLCDAFTLYYKDPTDSFPVGQKSSIPEGCSVLQLPVKPNQDAGNLLQLLSPEYDVEWNISAECLSCHSRGGKCLVNSDGEFWCEGGNGTPKRILLIGGVSLTAFVSTSILLFLFIRRKRTLLKLIGLQKAKPDSEKDIEFFLQNHGNLAHKRYKYSNLKKITNSFSDNLGEGGYGSVYKGKLPDGRLVAVKILNELKGNGEEFINEVASISKTSHINIVTLLGFCFEGSKRALIYDFMPNGSLEKFIQSSSASEGGLGWKKLFDIAVGIAHGLEYLHLGCNMRILHFDIKPHNILLDQAMNPRISDFGLAKLCPNRSSIVSMLAARGTIGYIAPEVLCRNFGEVSHKSDVYSYGMLVLELAGGKKNIDRGDVDHTSEIYFPQYIYRELEMDAEKGVPDGIMNEDESHFLKRKLIIVGLWCIQTDPRDRPSMSKVVDMLEGKLESLQVPPKPHLSSPPRSPPNFWSSESM